MYSRPPLLEEPFVQTLSGKNPTNVKYQHQECQQNKRYHQTLKLKKKHCDILPGQVSVHPVHHLCIRPPVVCLCDDLCGKQNESHSAEIYASPHEQNVNFSQFPDGSSTGSVKHNQGLDNLTHLVYIRCESHCSTSKAAEPNGRIDMFPGH